MEFPPLLPDVQKLMDLTTELVELFYWAPDAERPETHRCTTRSAASIQKNSGALKDIGMAGKTHEEGNSNNYSKIQNWRQCNT